MAMISRHMARPTVVRKGGEGREEAEKAPASARVGSLAWIIIKFHSLINVVQV